MKNLALLDVFRMASIPSSSIQAFSMPTVRSVPPRKGMTTLFGQHTGIRHNSSVICATMTAPVLEPSCDVTPTSKVAKTGEWSLEKMSSVQPGAKTNPLYVIKEAYSVYNQWNMYILMFLRSTEKSFHKRRKKQLSLTQSVKASD